MAGGDQVVDLQLQLKAFVNQDIVEAKYLYNDLIWLPVRWKYREFHTRNLKCLDIQRIEITRRNRGKGYCRRAMNIVCELADECGLTVSIDCVINPVILPMLTEFGFISINVHEDNQGIDLIRLPKEAV